MKKIYLLLIGMLLILDLQAQIIKTIENKAGKLDSLLTQAELNTITGLTITGTMDARDFKILRDEMPVLSDLNISAVTILEYYGTDGPQNESIHYDKNAIPWNSFSTDTDVPEGKVNLTSVILPENINEIGGFAFFNCTGLISIEIPALVTTVGTSAFAGCASLTGLSIPSATTIYDYAFKDCSSLTALTIPSSIKSISRGVFNGCTKLSSITLESLIPLMIYEPDNTFTGVDKSNCTLYVPYGTKDRYASASEWKDFNKIIESTHGFLLSSNLLKYEVTGGSTTININANAQWTAESDQSWLNVNPSSGNNSQDLMVTVDANVTTGARTGVIAFSAPGFHTQTIQVKQDSPMKTINITPGELKNALTDEEKATISSLTITGVMNATDFWPMNYQMPMLSKLDLSAVSIVSYKEVDPHCTVEVNYPANTLPGIAPYCPDYTLKPLDSYILPHSLTSIGWYALGGSNFSSIIIPPSVTSIEEAAFSECRKLTNITLPPALTYLGHSVFSNCSSLNSIVLPTSIKSIPSNTFANCISLNSIDIPSSVTTIEDDAFFNCISLKEILLPPSLTKIGYEAFKGCSALISIDIPTTVTSIDGSAFTSCTSLKTASIHSLINELYPYIFENCTSLSSIYFYNPTPPRIGGEDALHGVDRSVCTLYVPYGSAILYAAAPVWKEFVHIVEMEEFILSPLEISMESEQETATVELSTGVQWSAISNQPWLTIIPSSGSGSTSITVTAEANPSLEKRTASITFLTSQNTSPEIIVRQQGIPLTIEITAGNIANEFTATEQKYVNRLSITGTMDARDFKFIRDKLPYLIELDLSKVTITAYSGKGGTIMPSYDYPYDYLNEDYQYPENTIPIMAFRENKPDLTSVSLPASITSIGNYAFYFCTNLKYINIPSTVTFIGFYAFSSCINLQNIQLPPGLTIISEGLFDSCEKLSLLNFPPRITSIGKGAFYNCGSLSSIEIPSSVTSIGKNAFTACHDLTSITLPASLDSINEGTFGSTRLTSICIPATVKYIGASAFFACYLLKDFFAFPVNPPDLTMSPEVFYSVDQAKCILHVPQGSKTMYEAADQWKDFTHIVEMIPFTLSASELNIEAVPIVESIQISSNGAWSATCDKEWLTLSPPSGDSSQTVTFTCQQNMAFEPRTATVTFSDGNGYSQTVQVTQKARINNIPIANAGKDQIVEEGEMVQLDGSASMDADSDPLTYQWTAPEGISLITEDDAHPSFKAPKLEKDAIYTFNLVVNDGKVNSTPDQVLIAIQNKIIELGLSADSIVFQHNASSAKIFITGNAQWNISPVEDWLSVSPDSGEGQKEIQISALANETQKDRIAYLSISAPEVDAKTITVTQHGLITGVNKIANAMKITCYPNPFNDQITIEVANPSLKEINVEIYTISGQKIRTLLRAQKGAKINCTWDGRNENSKKVPNGMYLLKVNGEMRKVVKKNIY